MNKYKVEYTYTEPCEECPEVLVSGETTLEGESFEEVCEWYDSNLYYSRMHENFRVTKVELLEEDVEKIVHVKSENGNYYTGRGTLIRYKGNEHIIISRDDFRLGSLFDQLMEDHDVSFDKSKVFDLKVSKDG